MLKTLAGSRQAAERLITQFQRFMAGLVQDKDAILGSLDSVSNLAEQTSDLVTGIRPSFVKDVKGLRQVAGNLNAGRDELDRALQILPIKLTKIGRTAIYGSFFNFYLCDFQGNVELPTGGKTADRPTTSARPERGATSDERAKRANSAEPPGCGMQSDALRRTCWGGRA